MSQTYRDATWDWYRATFSTRIQEDGAIILVMTRWHEDDLAGRLLRAQEEGGDKWEVVNLPALAEDDDMLGRQLGEPLCPQLFTKETLEKTKVRLGSFWWNALYQQRPSPQEGGILKRHWWKFYRKAPDKFDEIIQSWDMTFKDTKTADFVVGQVWGRKGADKYLLDQVRDRMDFPATIQAVRTLSAKWPQARVKLVEDKANGPAVIATLKKEISGLIPVEPQGSKESRAWAVSPEVEAGNVYLPDPSIAPWVHDFIEECTVFPNGTNDDQVDAMTQALIRFSRHTGIFIGRA
jgi:predicted phage terminase large subunit-like protein